MMSQGTQLPSLWQWVGSVYGAQYGQARRFSGPVGQMSPNGAETTPRSRSLHRGKAEQPAQTPCLGAAAAAAEQLNTLPGFTPPSWHTLALGASSAGTQGE